MLAQTRARLIAVVPRFPDQAGRTSLPPNLGGRKPGPRLLRSAGGPRFAVYGLVNDAGIPIDVHAKVCLIDDTWGCVGSDTANRRSWTHDSELSCAVLDTETGTDMDVQAARSWAQALRLQLAAEHLGDAATTQDLTDPVHAFGRFEVLGRDGLLSQVTKAVLKLAAGREQTEHLSRFASAQSRGITRPTEPGSSLSRDRVVAAAPW